MYDHKRYQEEWRRAHPNYHKEHYRKNKDKYKKYRPRQWNRILIKNYGITFEEYKELLNEQNDCCKICGKHQSKFKRSLAVDHCHKTHKVRGLLCHHCNYALGHFFENVSILEQAIRYIKESAV